MFYEYALLGVRGAFGKVWLAAHWDNKLNKTERNIVIDTDIVKHSQQLIEHHEAVSLRTRGHLLVGLCRIYSHKVQFLYTDCNAVLVKLKKTFKPGVNIDLEHATANADAILLDNNAIDEYELVLPSLKVTLDMSTDGPEDLALDQLRDVVKLAGPATLGSPGFGLMARTPSNLSGSIFDDHEFDLLDHRRFSTRSPLGLDDFRAGASEASLSGDLFTELIAPHDEPLKLDYSTTPKAPSEAERAEWHPADFGEGPDMTALYREPYPEDVRQSIESQFRDLEMPQMPARRTAARRTFSSLLDAETTFSNDVLTKVIGDPTYWSVNEEILVAPLETRAIKRRKIENLTSNFAYATAPLLHGTAVPLRNGLLNAIRYEPMETEAVPIVSGRPSIDTMRGASETSRMQVDVEPIDRYARDKQRIDDYGGFDEHGVPSRRESTTDVGLSGTEFVIRPSQGEVVPSSQASQATQIMRVEALSKSSHDQYKSFRSAAVDTDTMSAQARFEHMNRGAVAASFLSLLEMASKDYIQLEQEEPYGAILIHFNIQAGSEIPVPVN